MLTTLSYLTSCFVVQKLHKETVGHACWLVGVFLTDVYLQLGTLYPEMRAPCGDTPAVRSRGAPSPWAAPEPCGANLAQVVSSTGSRGHGSCTCHRVAYGHSLTLPSSLHKLQERQETAEGIYSRIVFIQRCCFAQIIMNFFTGRGHGICLFRRAS